MKIADNIKCKDFKIIGRPSGDRLAGRENVWYYDIYYRGHLIDQKYKATSKTEAKAKISKLVKKTNAVLNKARRLQAEGRLEEILAKQPLGVEESRINPAEQEINK